MVGEIVGAYIMVGRALAVIDAVASAAIGYSAKCIGVGGRKGGCGHVALDRLGNRQRQEIDHGQSTRTRAHRFASDHR